MLVMFIFFFLSFSFAAAIFMVARDGLKYDPHGAEVFSLKGRAEKGILDENLDSESQSESQEGVYDRSRKIS